MRYTFLMVGSGGLKIAGWTAGICLLLLGLAAWATRVRHTSEVDPVSDQQKIARTLGIIRTSTPTDRKVLKVLFYGQSITQSGWNKIALEHWRQMYPNTIFVSENRALGGFSSEALVRTAEQDIAAFYPDLIVFHDYGDHRKYEQIIRFFRSQTAADIIVQTDHGEVLPDPPCAEGLHLTLHNPPGCVGFLWLSQRDWHDEMSYHKIPAFAKKYALAVEPQRTWWRQYLLRTHINPNSLLADFPHPNEQGKQLIAAFFDQYFDDEVRKWNGETEDNVVSIPPDKTEQSAGQDTVEFDGSRIELLSTKPLSIRPKAVIDGTASKDIYGCYMVTRASSIGTVPDWPALRRISLVNGRTTEDWTATLTHISPDQTSFSFHVTSSVFGDEGDGDSSHDFLSKSGEVRIEAQDWMVEKAFNAKHIPLREPFQVTWSVKNVCEIEPEAIDLGDGSMQYRYVLGAGLANERHTVVVPISASDLPMVSEFRAYKPPLDP